jgi:hypothetical protein
MQKAKIALLIIVCSTFGAIGGAAAGYYAALTTPSVSNIAVLDVEGLSKDVDQSKPDYMKRAQELSEKVNDITARLNAAGMVVLDRAYVISAPQDAIIHIDTQSK